MLISTLYARLPRDGWAEAGNTHRLHSAVGFAPLSRVGKAGDEG